MRKVLGLLAGLMVIAGITMIVHQTHPILLKYIFGSARIIGKPIEVRVFTDGHLNKGIKVYKDPKYPNEYILSLNAFDEDGMLNISMSILIMMLSADRFVRQ